MRFSTYLGPLSVAVPGEVRGYFSAKQKYGNPVTNHAKHFLSQLNEWFETLGPLVLNPVIISFSQQNGY